MDQVVYASFHLTLAAPVVASVLEGSSRIFNVFEENTRHLTRNTALATFWPVTVLGLVCLPKCDEA